jgi:hypothetical protein
MKAQTPAEGILKTNDWGDSKVYRVACSCGASDHDHHLWVEADNDISVTIYANAKTNYWSNIVEPRYDIKNTIYQNIYWFWTGVINDWYRRITLAWKILSKGYVKYEAVISMNEQQALNYAETLKSAVKDVKEFRKPKEKSPAAKLAEQQDCV